MVTPRQRRRKSGNSIGPDLPVEGVIVASFPSDTVGRGWRRSGRSSISGLIWTAITWYDFAR